MLVYCTITDYRGKSEDFQCLFVVELYDLYLGFKTAMSSRAAVDSELQQKI